MWRDVVGGEFELAAAARWRTGRWAGMFQAVSTREIPASRLRGGRVADSGSFPDTHEAYRDMTPSERIEAMRRLSARLYAIARQGADVPERRPGVPDRLIGGRR